MIDGTEKPKIPLNFAKLAARYREFGYKEGCLGVFYASWKYLLWLGNSAWDFLGDKFWSSDFFGF